MKANDKRINHAPLRRPHHLSGMPAPAPADNTVVRRLGNRGIQHLPRTHLVQAKLSVSAPDDVYEQEADRVADQVMRMPEPAAGIDRTAAPHIQRLCPACEEDVKRQPLDEDEPFQAKTEPEGVPEVGPEAETAIRALAGRGQPLPDSVRNFMEPRFDADFRAVRVHTDTSAQDLARSVDAQAFTVGPNIVFGTGRYAPETERGRHLLAHELTHVVQQSTLASDTGGNQALQQMLYANTEEYELGKTNSDELTRVIQQNGGTPRSARQRASDALNVSASPLGVSRTPDEAAPRPLRTDVASLPGPGDGTAIHVIRKLFPCECRRVPDVREGVYYNRDLDAFAIAYRHCEGSTTGDVYARVESNLSSFLSGGTPPAVTARLGFEINVFGRQAGGRVQLEFLGSNVSGEEGVGGRAQVVFQGGEWLIFVNADFLHRLGATRGDELNFDLGARFGPVTVRVQVSNVLSPNPSGSGEACFDTSPVKLCPYLSVSSSPSLGEVIFGFRVRGTLDEPEVHEEGCFQCLCPPPRRAYECFVEVPPSERQEERSVDVEVPGLFQYYFRLNRTTPSEESQLRAQSQAALNGVVTEVADGGSVSMITGYASPEGTEAHNAALGDERARRLGTLLAARLPTGTVLPAPSSGGELLGSRPTPSPTSRLGDVISTHGFRSAEDLSVLLLGDDILRPELSDQFVSLFNALPDAADRLAVFNLGPGDPLEPRVLSSIDQFLRNPRAGPRPWESVFRLLRVGVIRTVRPHRQVITATVRDRGRFDPLEDGKCRDRGHQAERSSRLPALPPGLPTPDGGSGDRDRDCGIDVSAADRRGGCSYTLPHRH